MASILTDYLDALVLGAEGGFRLALALPASGALGLTRPAALAAAILAAEEVNAAGGVRGRELSLTPVNAGHSARTSAAELAALIDGGAVSAVVGFHTSDVRRALEPVTTGRVPYVFAAPHEGGRHAPGVGLVGPDPATQLVGPIHALRVRGAARWALLGNDYVWPRVVHRVGGRIIREAGADVVGERLVAIGAADAAELVAWVARSRAQAVLLSLVGRDLAAFNRAFGPSPLAGRVARLSGALDEVGLLEAGGDASGGLFAAMDWYAAADRADGFEERYLRRWGPTAPQVGVYARGCYEAIHVVAAAAAHGRLSATVPNAGLPAAPPRPARLAVADGLDLIPTGRRLIL